MLVCRKRDDWHDKKSQYIYLSSYVMPKSLAMHTPYKKSTELHDSENSPLKCQGGPDPHRPATGLLLFWSIGVHSLLGWHRMAAIRIKRSFPFRIWALCWIESFCQYLLKLGHGGLYNVGIQYDDLLLYLPWLFWTPHYVCDCSLCLQNS
jgi:hypothetical protein